MSKTTAAKAPRPAAGEPGHILPDNIGFVIRVVQMRIFREFYRAFEGAGMTPGAYTVLAIIRDNPGVRQRTLAELLMVREPNMTRVIQSLEAEGLVQRAVDKTDRRAFHLRLSDQGRQTMDAMSPRIDAFDGSLLKDLDPGERKALRSYLDRILAGLER